MIAVITADNQTPGNGSQMVPAQPSGTAANIGGNAEAGVCFDLFCFDMISLSLMHFYS